jgi:hypothetical protein
MGYIRPSKVLLLAKTRKISLQLRKTSHPEPRLPFHLPPGYPASRESFAEGRSDRKN